MDYNDYQAGATSEHFWFKAKRQLIFSLLNSVEHSSQSSHPSIPQGERLKKGVRGSAEPCRSIEPYEWIQKRSILNIGAGTGDDLAIIQKFGAIYAIDVNQKALDLIPSHLVFEKKLTDACNLSYQDNFFDRIVAFDVLEHIENDQQAVCEILRTLKPGGFFIFTVPAFNFLYSEHDRKLEHYRRYNKPMIRKLFTEFKQIRLGYWNFLLFPAAVLQRIINKNRKNKEVMTFNATSKVNTPLYTILNFETQLITYHVPFPYGLSLFGIYQKTR